jgi:hypothetical protein
MGSFKAEWDVEAERLKEQARRARRLATSTTDVQLMRALLALADDYDAELAKMTARQEAEQAPDSGAPSPPPAATASPLSQPPPMEPETD